MSASLYLHIDLLQQPAAKLNGDTPPHTQHGLPKATLANNKAGNLQNTNSTWAMADITFSRLETEINLTLGDPLSCVG